MRLYAVKKSISARLFKTFISISAAHIGGGEGCRGGWGRWGRGGDEQVGMNKYIPFFLLLLYFYCKMIT
jgi:hypothetical protein